MALILHIEQGLSVLHETDEKNAKRAHETDQKHRLQAPDYQHDQKIHEASIVFDPGDVEQNENQIDAGIPRQLCYSSDVRRIHPSAWGLVLLSAVLQVVIFPLAGIYWLSWIAVTPLLIAVLRARPAGALPLEGAAKLVPASPWQGFLLAYACGVLWSGGTCYWIYDTMHRYGGLPVPAAAFVLVLFCLYIGLYHGLFGFLLALAAAPRASLRRPLVAAPFLWVAVELARTRITAFPWELLGYAQTSNVALTRIATITGVYGLSFEILLVNTAFAAGFLVDKSRRKSLLLAAFWRRWFCRLGSG